MSVHRHSAVRLENYIPLIAKIARQHHSHLPVSRRIWVDPEDMVHDGIEIATTRILPNFVRGKGAVFTTWLQTCLDHYFQNYIKASYCQKRNNGLAIPLEDIAYLLADKSFKLNVDGLVAKDLLLRIYELASPNLQYYMCLWFFVQDAAIPNPNDRRALKSKAEFLQLCTKLGVTVEVCRSFFAYKASGAFMDSYARRVNR